MMLRGWSLRRLARWWRGCPTSEQLAAFIEARLPADEDRRVTAHLARCAECRWLVVRAAETLEAIGDSETQ
jgi:predicted anti-sigma-YlaC factor YlaD